MPTSLIDPPWLGWQCLQETHWVCEDSKCECSCHDRRRSGYVMWLAALFVFAVSWLAVALVVLFVLWLRGR